MWAHRVGRRSAELRLHVVEIVGRLEVHRPLPAIAEAEAEARRLRLGVTAVLEVLGLRQLRAEQDGVERQPDADLVGQPRQRQRGADRRAVVDLRRQQRTVLVDVLDVANLERAVLEAEATHHHHPALLPQVVANDRARVDVVHRDAGGGLHVLDARDRLGKRVGQLRADHHPLAVGVEDAATDRERRGGGRELVVVRDLGGAAALEALGQQRDAESAADLDLAAARSHGLAATAVVRVLDLELRGQHVPRVALVVLDERVLTLLLADVERHRLGRLELLLAVGVGLAAHGDLLADATLRAVVDDLVAAVSGVVIAAAVAGERILVVATIAAAVVVVTLRGAIVAGLDIGGRIGAHAIVRSAVPTEAALGAAAIDERAAAGVARDRVVVRQVDRGLRDPAATPHRADLQPAPLLLEDVHHLPRLELHEDLAGLTLAIEHRRRLVRLRLFSVRGRDSDDCEEEDDER